MLFAATWTCVVCKHSREQSGSPRVSPKNCLPSVAPEVGAFEKTLKPRIPTRFRHARKDESCVIPHGVTHIQHT